MIILDLGSSDCNRWYTSQEEDTIYHLDEEEYPGTIKWEGPNNLPFKNNSIDKIFAGQFIIYLTIQGHLQLAEEINRVLKRTGCILIHDFDGVLGYVEFFKKLESLRWFRVSEELNNYAGKYAKTYLVELHYFEQVEGMIEE